MLDWGEYITEADYSQGNGYDQLDGDWALFYKVARYFVHKVKREDREDFLHNLMLEMATVKVKYEAKGKPLIEAGLMRVASYEVTEYWVKQRRLTTWLDCGNCSKEQRRKCRDQDLYSECPKFHQLVSLNMVIGDDDMREVKSNVEWVRDATLQTAENVRRISLDLRPSILDDLGLVPALRWLVDRMNKESDINTRILVNGVERKLSPQVEITLFRVVQEALNNIKRHSKAKEAAITLEFTTECFKITIEDNGQGFRTPEKFDKLAAKGKLGLIGIQQKTNFLNGTLEIHSMPGKGTLLLIEAKC